MRYRIAAVAGTVALLCTLGACSRDDGPWNVVVIVPDTVRGDHLGINGSPRTTSPHIDELARNGTSLSAHRRLRLRDGPEPPSECGPQLEVA